MNKVAIFKTGDHTATNGSVLNASADYLRDIVASYQPTQHEAPVVIGHPKDNAPAWGWVKALSFNDSDGTLYADLDQLEPTFAEWLASGRYKKRSASFYPPNHPSNPTPGKPYLRHVGFLGAQPPAVKGLPDFADDANVPVYEFSDPKNQPTQPLTQNQEDNMDKEDEKKAAELTEKEKALAELEAKLAEKEAELEKREAELEAEKAAAEKAEAADFAESLIKTGQLLPAEKVAVTEVIVQLGKDSTFDFSEGGAVTTKSTVDALKDVLKRLPTTVDFSEHSGGDPNDRTLPQHINGATDEDKAAAELDAKIQSFAEKHNISYAQAAQQIGE